MAPVWLGPPAIVSPARPRRAVCTWVAPRDPYAPLADGVVIRVRVDGLPLWATLDTGSNADFLVSRAVAARLGLRRAGAVRVAGVAGDARTWWGQGELALGPWRVSVRIVVLPMLAFPLLGLPPIGELDLELMLPPGDGFARFDLATCGG